MTKRLFSILLLMTLALDAFPQSNADQSRQIRLLALDAYGRVISGLKPENLLIKSGREKPGVSKMMFEENEPVAVAILINDRTFPDAAAYVALRFAQNANSSNEYCVIASNETAEVLANWQRAGSSLTSTLKQIAEAGKKKDRSVLFDAVALGLKKLAESSLKKKAVLIFGNGYDLDSKTKIGTLKELLRASDAVVNAVSITFDPGWRILPRDEVLEKITEPTGGRVLQVYLDSGIETVFPRPGAGNNPPLSETRQKPASLIRNPDEYLSDISEQLAHYIEKTYLVEFLSAANPDKLDVQISLRDTSGNRLRTTARFRVVTGR
jgi:hypothetical protein